MRKHGPEPSRALRIVLRDLVRIESLRGLSEPANLDKQLFYGLRLGRISEQRLSGPRLQLDCLHKFWKPLCKLHGGPVFLCDSVHVSQVGLFLSRPETNTKVALLVPDSRQLYRSSANFSCVCAESISDYRTVPLSAGTSGDCASACLYGNNLRWLLAGVPAGKAQSQANQ